MSRFLSIILIISVIFFTACSTRGKRVYSNTPYSAPKSYSSNKSNYSSSVSNKNYSHPTMRPYVIRGIRYYPTVVSVGDRFSGRASWYGPDFHGKHTSNGERYNMYDMTAAHKTLPMNTIVKVTNQSNGLSIIVRINDRGPFINTRIIDLSKSGASKINMIATGTAPVELEILGFEVKGKKRIPTRKELKKSPQRKSISGFAIQIASFSNIDGALKTQEAFDKKDGYSTVIKDIQTENGRAFKVWLKGFKSEQEARDYKAQGHFKNAFIVREE
ncbi:septal ring lytic transglycosylase RlpA family protein [Sulfurimonas sp.]|uniref:septal ring lytic transglycosylase RlpA family protein n=1 Tax=Sulfurimonas sp. TaxID=2022749 RepID=UPI002AB06316|nr:septal ring lytic transglycosylase RlpA family protein [Sulfurimonas sp.]